MSPVRARRGRSRTSRSRRWWTARCRSDRRAPRTGACGRWPKPLACQPRPWAGPGAPLACPHRAETFKLSTDPLFAEKVRDVVGLYLAPPDRALVLCVDEKSQVQALDHTQPLLPLRPGQAERHTHDYICHGTTSLFAALDVKAGTVISQCFPRHRAAEFRRFLDEIGAQVPPDLDIHLVLDNAGTYKTKLIRDWLAKRPRYHVHFRLLDQPGRALVWSAD